MDPTLVPSSEARRAARERLREALPTADEVRERCTDEIAFVDAGEAFDALWCPSCGGALELDWWGDAMTAAAERGFTNLGIVTPCCRAETTLADLRYERPQGLALRARGNEPRRRRAGRRPPSTRSASSSAARSASSGLGADDGTVSPLHPTPRSRLPGGTGIPRLAPGRNDSTS